MPGGDAREAAKTVTGSFADGRGMPHLAELPARGPGTDMIGRTVGLLVDLYGHVEPSGWRISDRPGRDTRRARSWLGEDLDALEEFTQGYEGLLKVQAVGPWALAAALELRGGEAMLADPGACRDLADSLAEGLRAHLADVRRRVPGATVALQLDEPSLTAVLRGCIRDGPTLVHSCAPEVPFALLRRAGADGIAFDFSLLTEREEEAIGEAVEGGTHLFLGVVPSTDAATTALSDPGGSVMGVRTLWSRLGLSPGTLAESVAITPSCGLAGASPAYARTALAHSARAAKSLADNPE